MDIDHIMEYVVYELRVRVMDKKKNFKLSETFSSSGRSLSAEGTFLSRVHSAQNQGLRGIPRQVQRLYRSGTLSREKEERNIFLGTWRDFVS